MKYSLIAACGVVLSSLLISPPPAVSQNGAPCTLRVNLTYTGSGNVDEKHKLYAVLWDSSDFVKGEQAIPMDIKSLSTKSGSVTFENIQKTPVYVSTVYDASGTWDAQSPPPDGSSLGLYSKTPGEPAPIELEPGKTKTVDVRFGDSTKMQGGKPTR